MPRPPAEIVDGVVTNDQGVSVDREFRLGAQRCLAKLEGEDVSLVILQPRSPSCGTRQVYDGTFSGTLIEGQGVFAQLLTERGYCVVGADEV